jgi:MFS family permease
MHISPDQRYAALPRLLAIETATWFGTYATPVVLAFAVLDRGGGSGRVGIVLAADTIGMLISTPYGGSIADRLPRNVVMCAAEVAAASFQGAAVLVLATGAGALPWLAVLQGLVGVSRGFFYPAATGLVPSLIREDRARQRANGLLGTAQAAARLGAPPLAGVAVAVSGAEAALLVNVGAYSASALLLFGFPRVRGNERPEPVRHAIRKGWAELRAREWIWLTVAWFSALQCLAQAPLLVLGPKIAQRSLHGSAGWGLVLGGLGAGAAAGAALRAILRPQRPLRPAIAAYALVALPLLALAAPVSLPLVVASSVLAGAGAGFFSATWFSIFQRNVPRNAISRISAWDWEASLAGLPLGMLLAPPLAHLLGASLTLTAAAVASVVVTLFVARRSSLAAVTASIAAPTPALRR